LKNKSIILTFEKWEFRMEELAHDNTIIETIKKIDFPHEIS